MRRWISYLSILPLTFLFGCTTGSLEELRATHPTGTPFQNALSSEYLQLSDREALDYDWSDSQFFAEKGLRAAYGHDVEPEKIDDWSIPDEIRPELEAARQKLLANLTAENKRDKTEAAARAQASFDCWLEEQEEGWQLDAIKTCKSRFYAAMESLEFKPEPIVTESPKPLIRSTAYMVFFDHNRVAITPEAQSIIDKVIADFKQYDDTVIMLHGHTDTSGTEPYNMTLSEKRALAVSTMLKNAGIGNERISYFAFGETDLRVPTADGIREPGNRRVEIFLE